MGSIITITDHAHGIIDNITEDREGEVNTDELEKDMSDKDQEFCSKVDETDISDELNNATCISDSGKCINSV